jgi:pyruvate formate lyase activating enzyme
VIDEGKGGLCLARVNEKGVLFTQSYSRSCSTSIDPIEKKPLFHFNPGARVFSVASPFCNFFCSFCDNWMISQQRRLTDTKELIPKSLVNSAQSLGCQGISYTYTEPTVFFEWAYDSAKLAHEKGLFNTFVTNGYITPEAVKTISPYLDAATVDFKGGGDPVFYRDQMRVPQVEPIYESLMELKHCGIHLEITNLLVPKYGDSMTHLRELATWICENLGEETPFHLLRFFPNYELIDVPQTPVNTVEEARKIAVDAGLRYVYAGNIPGHPWENTYCPQCHELLIERHGFSIRKWTITPDKTCPKCRKKIAITGGHY